MKAVLTLTGVLMLPVLLAAQTLNLNLDGMAAKAKEKAEINLDAAMIEAGKQMMGEKAAKLPPGLKSATIRHYEFAEAGQYSDSDLDPIRKQVATGWSRLVTVKDKKQSVEIFTQASGDKPTAFLLLVAEPKEVTVVHVMGSIDLAQLKELVTSKVAGYGEVAQ